MRDKLGNKISPGDLIWPLDKLQNKLTVLEVHEGGVSQLTVGGEHKIEMPRLKVEMTFEIQVDPRLLASGAEAQVFDFMRIVDPAEQFAKDKAAVDALTEPIPDKKRKVQ